jgi:hypothetical protein
MSYERENKYFHLSKLKQRIFRFKLSLTALVVILISVLLPLFVSVYLWPIVPILCSIVLSVIAPFFDVPAMVKAGKLHYHSAMFLSEPKRKGIIKIHGGTLFDYYFNIDRKLGGSQRTAFVLSAFLTGLLDLVQQETDETKLVGTSYFLNERTAKKIGFTKVRTDNLQGLISYFNYFNLMFSNYLIKGRLTFPSMRSIGTYSARVSEIRKNKSYILGLREKLENTASA